MPTVTSEDVPAPLDSARFSAWMHAHAGLSGVELGDLLSGGNANVTQLVKHTGGLAVIRRPPQQAISSGAARGLRREYEMLRSLKGSARVPCVYGFCDDPTILGQPFLVVEHIDGTSITTELPGAYARDPGALQRIGEQLVDAIAAVHSLDPRSLGLDANHGHDYVPRTVARWLKVRAEARVRDLPLLDELAQWFLTRWKPQMRTSIIHGDFHLDNTLFSRQEPRLEAMIDWELATVGDPLADVALMLMFWGPRAVEPPGFSFVQAVSRGHPTVTRTALAERWARVVNLPIDDLGLYLSFSFWRLAAIVEGAYVLYRRGLVSNAYSRGLEYDVPALLTEAAMMVGLR